MNTALLEDQPQWGKFGHCLMKTTNTFYLIIIIISTTQIYLREDTTNKTGILCL